MVQALGAIPFCGLLPFAVIRFVRGYIVIAAIEAFGAITAIGRLLCVHRAGRTQFAGLVLGVVFILVVSAIIYLGGTTEVYFLHPTVIVSYFLLTPNVAFVICMIAVSGLSPELYSRMEAEEFGRFFASMLGCVFFSYAFATIRNGQRDELLHLSTRDGLTGAGNRRAMDQRIEEPVDAFKRSDSIVSMLILDLDRFKKIKDGRGHALWD